MDLSGEIYEVLLARLYEEMPDVALEIETAVAEGNRVEAARLPAGERSDLNSRLGPKHTRISKDDLITVPYSADERLTILIRALQTLARSMTANRAAVADLTSGRTSEPALIFRAEGGQEQDIRIETSESSAQYRSLMAEAEQLLAGAEAELG